MVDELQEVEPDTPPSEKLAASSLPGNVVVRLWRKINLIWEESEVVRGITGAVVGAILMAPFGSRDLVIIGVFVGALAFSMDYIPWRKRLKGSITRPLQGHEREVIRYTKLIEQKPNDAVIYFRRGLAHAELKHYDQAIADFGQAIGLRPDDTPAYLERGSIYIEQKQYRQAAADFDQALAGFPHRAEIYAYRASVYVQTGDQARAIADYKQVVALAHNPALQAEAQQQLIVLETEAIE